MPFTLEIDDARRRVAITVVGEFLTADAEQALEQQRQGGAWSYGVLYDMRRVTAVPTLDEVKRIFAAAAEPGPDNEKRGPLAVVVTDPKSYSIACAYMALGGATRKIEVFRELGEAEQWLGHHTRSSP